MTSIDFIAESFRKEIEESDFRQLSHKRSILENPNKQNPHPKELGNHNTEVAELNELVICRSVRANFNFKAENENELSLNKGEIIQVIKYIDEGWWFGICNGEKGMFPSNYVSDA